jgi:hypothetical protein
MTGDPVPFLWLCGPSGVGKTTVGFEIFSQLERAGIRTGCLDLDQVGLCYPATGGDPENHDLKARNFGAVWPNFLAAGVRCLVVSGGVDTPDRVRTYADLVPGAALTLCRLRAGRDELTRRFVGRGWQIHLAGEAVAESAVLDRLDFAEVCVDTDGRSVPEVARLVRERAGGWPRLT